MRVQGGPEDAGERRAAQEGSEQLTRAQGSADQPKEGSRELKAAEESSVLVLSRGTPPSWGHCLKNPKTEVSRKKNEGRSRTWGPRAHPILAKLLFSFF